MRYLIDSDWVIDGTAGIPAALDVINRLGPEGVGISTVAIAEVLEGAFLLSDLEAGIANFRRFMAAFVVLDVTEPIAEVFARVRFDLRRQGNLIPDTDLLIAATALHHD